MSKNFKDLEGSFPGLKREYTFGTLERRQLSPDPIQQFAKWITLAVRKKASNPNVMVLATSTRSGKVSARSVLLKGFDKEGFVFYTNYASRKGKNLAENANASVVFYWPEIQKQVVIAGRARKLSRRQSEKYFRSRPRMAQLASWASAQGREIGSRKELESKVRSYEEKFRGREVPLPPAWGGYRLVPERIEFWQGRRSRLNDRFLYERKKRGWTCRRLQP